MTANNFHRRLLAVETAERANDQNSYVFSDMSAYSDDELRILKKYAQRAADGEQIDLEEAAAELLALQPHSPDDQTPDAPPVAVDELRNPK